MSKRLSLLLRGKSNLLSLSIARMRAECCSIVCRDIKERLIDSAPGGGPGGPGGAKATGAGSMSLGQGQTGEQKSGCC